VGANFWHTHGFFLNFTYVKKPYAAIREKLGWRHSQRLGCPLHVCGWRILQLPKMRQPQKEGFFLLYIYIYVDNDGFWRGVKNGLFR